MKDMLKIRVNDEYLDLLPNAEVDFFITRQAHLIQDLETRNGDITRQITIPASQTNIRILNYNIPSLKNNFVPQQEILPCLCEMGGLPVLNDSLLFVVDDDVINETITIDILGSQVLFFTLLSEDSIRDLEFEPVEWTLQGLAAKTIGNSDFLYGNAVYIDNLSASKYIDEKAGLNDMYVGQREVEASGGWFFFKTVVERILHVLEAKGLIFDTSILDENDIYQNMVFQLPVTQLYDNYDALTPMYSYVTNNIAYAGSGTTRPRFDVIESEDPSGLWNNAVGDEINRGFTLTHAGLVSIDLYSEAEVFLNTGLGDAIIYDFFVNNISIYTARVPISQTGDTYISRRDTYIFDAEVGDFVYWRIVVPSGRSFGYLPATIMKIRRQLGEFGATVYPSQWFPNISQKDFIRELFKFFHIVPLENDRLVTWKYWDKIAENEHQDIVPFIDVSQPIITKDYIEGYAQENYFSYTDHDLVERFDTDDFIAMNKRLLPEKMDLVKSPFVPCDPNAIEHSGRVSVPLFKMEYEHVDDNKIAIALGSDFFEMVEAHGLEVGDHIFVWDDQALETMKRKVITILDDYSGYVDVVWNTNHDAFDWDYLKYTKTGITFQIGYATGTISGNGDIWDGGLYQSIQNWNDIIFADAQKWDELINSYYPNFRSSIFNAQMVSAWLNMPLINFIQLDFARPIYARNDLFYINTLEQYKNDGSVRGEFFRIVKSYEGFIGGTFTVTPENDINMGAWVTGDPPLQQDYIIENTGLIPLIVEAIISGDSSIFYSPSAPVDLEPTESGTITIFFHGSQVTGAKPVLLSFNAAGATNAIRNITANVLTLAISIEPVGAVNLGTWYEGGEIKEQLYITTNIGTSPITIAWAIEDASDGWQAIGTTPITLQPNESGNQVARYNGNLTDIGNVLATLRYEESLDRIPDVLRGLGLTVLADNFTNFPLEFVFDWQQGYPPNNSIITLTNTGSRNLLIAYTNTSPLWSYSHVSPVSVPAQGAVVFTATFNGATTAGNKTNVLTFTSGAAVGVTTITARMAAAAFTVAPVAAVDLPIWGDGDPPQDTIYTLTNGGSINLTITAAIGMVGFSIVGTNPVIVAPEGNAQITVRFSGNTSNVAGVVTFTAVGLPQQQRNINAYYMPAIMAITPASYPIDWWMGLAITRIYTIQNTGYGTLNVAISRTGSAWWSYSGAANVNIPRNQIYNATLIFSYPQGGGPSSNNTVLSFVSSQVLDQTRQATINTSPYDISPNGTTQWPPAGIGSLLNYAFINKDTVARGAVVSVEGNAAAWCTIVGDTNINLPPEGTGNRNVRYAGGAPSGSHSGTFRLHLDMGHYTERSFIMIIP